MMIDMVNKKVIIGKEDIVEYEFQMQIQPK
jgi:hypothetical protein